MSAPVLVLPRAEVAVDGTPLPGSAQAAITSVRVARRLSQPAQCELSFVVDAAGTLGGNPSAVLPIGAELAVAVTGDTGDLFRGQVTGHEWCYEGDRAAELRVRAYDPLHRLRKRQRVEARTDLTVADLAGELASAAGLGVDAAADGPRWPVLVQHQDDLSLLQEVTEAAGLWFVVGDGSLRLFDLTGVDDPVTLVLGSGLRSARLDATAEPACRAVRALGWDPVAATPLEADAGGARQGWDAAAGTAPDAVDGDGERHLAGRHGPTADHLEAAAQAELDRLVAREVTLAGVADGDPRLVPGRRVRIDGVHPEVAGTYVLTATVHTLDARGYAVELSSMPPAPVARPAAVPAATATLAEVLEADDPDHLGRVRVTLPAYAGVETDWRPVLTIGAGAGKGLVAVPDAGDRVLVLLPAGDPAAAVVLGGLFGDVAPDDTGLVGGAVKRWSLRTGGGQRVVLDDERGRVVVANGDGSTIDLAPDRVTLHAAADLTIEAPGATLTLRANRIAMEQASSPEDGPTLPGHG